MVASLYIKMLYLDFQLKLNIDNGELEFAYYHSF